MGAEDLAGERKVETCTREKVCFRSEWEGRGDGAESVNEKKGLMEVRGEGKEP